MALWDDAYWVRIGELRGMYEATVSGRGGAWRQGAHDGSDWGRSVQVFDQNGRQIATCGGDILIQCQWNASFIAMAHREFPRLLDDLGKMHSLVDGAHEETFDALIGKLETAEQDKKQLEKEVALHVMERERLIRQRDQILSRVRDALSQGSLRRLRDLETDDLGVAGLAGTFGAAIFRTIEENDDDEN